jgi:hypothetical protein
MGLWIGCTLFKAIDIVRFGVYYNNAQVFGVCVTKRKKRQLDRLGYKTLGDLVKDLMNL